jgi:hypothetical protein
LLISWVDILFFLFCACFIIVRVVSQVEGPDYS